ncbi:MAG: hypothetical protein ABW145_02430, partial [Candidatus Thiodiazotropha sp.]
SLDTKTHKPDNITAEKTTQTTTPFTQHEETNNREETGRIEDDYQPHQDQPDMTEVFETATNIHNNATEFYNTVFPGMVQNSTGNYVHEAYSEATIGEGLQVEDYFKRGPSSLLVPHISGGSVIAISMYRKFDGKDYAPARMVDVSDKQWGSFPPISQMDAESILMEKMPHAYTLKTGLVHVDNLTPNYQFAIPGEDNIVYLVNAFTGKIDVFPADYTMPEDQEEKPPVKLDENGLLSIDTEKAASLSPETRSKLKADIEISNQAIKSGLLKIGPNMDVIYDKRPSITIKE